MKKEKILIILKKIKEKLAKINEEEINKIDDIITYIDAIIDTL